MKPETQSYLVFEWKQTLQAIRAVGDHTDLLEEIFQAYTQPERHYHTTEHLAHGFRVFDKWLLKLPGASSIKLAFWYHDFVYHTRELSNELMSSEVAKDRLRALLPRDEVEFIGDLILSTRHLSQALPQTPEAKALVDMDLAILGETTEVFGAYEVAIRQEYSWAPEGDFRKARGDFVLDLLDRPYIYSTLELRNSAYEARAKINLASTLVRLT